MVRFDFRKEKSKHFGTIYRPVAKVKLFGEVIVKEIFYVDSGADLTIIPRSVGELLGLKLKESEIIDLYGVGEGALSVVIKKIKMVIVDKKIEARIGWALTEKVPLLLGRLDIFDKFEVIFNQNEGFIDFISLKNVVTEV